MIEVELLSKVTSEGWVILQQKELEKEGTGDALLTGKAIAVCKPLDSVLERKWLKYYLKTDGTCYWQEYNPFPAVPAMSFGEQVRTKINALVTAATIKAGYVERMDEPTQTALVVAVKSDNSLAIYHVCKVAGALTITAVTGTYPI